MTLPRFTSGSVGRLEFSTLNDAFGYIDAERSTTKNPGARPQGSNWVFGRIIGPPPAEVDPTGMRHAWAEVELSENLVWQYVDGGRNSGPSNTGNAADFFRYPAIAWDLDSPALQDDAVYILFPKIEGSGKLVYVAHPRPELPRLFRIDANASVSEGRWRYTGTQMRMTQAQEYVLASPSFTSTRLFNSVEAIPDSTQSTTFGVGSVRPTGSTVTRQPIRNGTIVVASMTGFARDFFFSVPNGYSIGCPP